jgi:hypothetical protein
MMITNLSRFIAINGKIDGKNIEYFISAMYSVTGTHRTRDSPARKFYTTYLK